MLAMTLFALTLAAAGAPAQGGGSLAIQARKLHLGDGRTLDKGILIVEDGKFRAVGASADLPSGVRVVQHDGVITPGFVVAREEWALGAEGIDTTRALLPEARVADGFDPKSRDLRRAAALGVTTLLLAPGTETLVPGQTAVVKTRGGRMLSPASHLAVTLSASALTTNLPPTSPMGALALLEDELKESSGAFGAVKAGRLPLMIHAVERHEVQRAIEFVSRNGLKGSIEGAPLAGELADQLKAAGLSVVLSPFSGGDDRRALRSVVQLGKAEVPFAFGLDSARIGPESLRLSAAMCLREGVDRGAVERALFSTAASICGVGDRVGRLERGMDADFILWSGDPLDLTSRLEAVYVDGKRVDPSQP